MVDYLEDVRKVNQHHLALGITSASDVEADCCHLPGRPTLNEVDVHCETEDLHRSFLKRDTETQGCDEIVDMS